MSFPIIGLIADDLTLTSFTDEANKLGVTINFSAKKFETDQLVEFSKLCDVLCIEPNHISLSALKTIQRSGVLTYPPIQTIEQLDKIQKHQPTNEMYSILVARSGHAQVSTWPISLITGNISITPVPGMSEELASRIQLSVIKLAGEIGLVGAVELIVDADDFTKLISINWLNPVVQDNLSVGSITSYAEQFLRAVLDLPLGSTEALRSYTVSGSLTTDENSNDYRPYLHLMARNPNLKFNQATKRVSVIGDNVENY
jgi:Phosphoribosylaminoimidazole carboxylase (NCAIR synthetase)